MNMSCPYCGHEFNLFNQQMQIKESDAIGHLKFIVTCPHCGEDVYVWFKEV